jgi:hypothetical protein
MIAHHITQHFEAPVVFEPVLSSGHFRLKIAKVFSRPNLSFAPRFCITQLVQLRRIQVPIARVIVLVKEVALEVAAVRVYHSVQHSIEIDIQDHGQYIQHFAANLDENFRFGVHYEPLWTFERDPITLVSSAIE